MPVLRRLCLFAILSAIAAFGCPAGETAGEVFSWRQASGRTLRILLNKHPYAEGVRRRIPDFERLTGIRVAYSMHHESVYFDVLETSFDSGGAASPDVYMTGVYQIWEYAVKGRAAALDTYIQNPAATRQGYDVNDFFPAISGAFRWNRKAGSPVGEGPLWAIPMGFESFALTYNREVLARSRLPVPRTMEELVETGRRLREFEGPGTYGIAARGRPEWGSVHSGYITTFANYGAKDMEVENGRLTSRVNSPEAVAVTDLWATMLRECGPGDWDQYDWTRCLADLGARRATFLFDADILGYSADFPGATAQSGKLALAPPPAPAGTPPDRIKSNLWVWGLAMNPASKNDLAAWLFIQYFTGREFQAYSVLEWQSVNPPRRSVFENPEFRKVVSRMPGFLETFSSLVENTTICFTPTPIFFDISRRWASVVVDIARGAHSSTQEGMDALKAWMDEKLSEVPVD